MCSIYVWNFPSIPNILNDPGTYVYLLATTNWSLLGLQRLACRSRTLKFAKPVSWQLKVFTIFAKKNNSKLFCLRLIR